MEEVEYQERIHELIVNLKDGKDMSDLTNIQLMVIIMNIVMTSRHDRISLLFNFDDMVQIIKDILDYSGSRYRITNKSEQIAIYIYGNEGLSVQKVIGIMDYLFGSTMAIGKVDSTYIVESM